jgi:hypothetical protein
MQGFQNVTVENVTETVGEKTHRSIRLTLKSTHGEWVIDVADGESPMATIETPSGNWHDVVLGSKGDIIVH